MAGGQYADAKMVCPYFIKQTGQTITCEGTTEGGSLKLYFTDAMQKGVWSSHYCTSLQRYFKCPVCACIDEARKE